MQLLLATSKLYDTRPSSLMDISDPYTAYCFDEAAAYIVAQIKAKKKPHWTKEIRHEAGGNKAVAQRLLLSGAAARG